MPPTQPTVKHQPIRLAGLASGSGSTLQNLCDRIASGTLNAQLACIIASNPAAAQRIEARQLGVPTILVDRKTFESPAGFSDVVFDHLRQADVDLVCLAGFLSLLCIPDDFAWRVINIHPALLPAFGGRGMFGHRVHEAVLEHGCKVSGCTVHFADQTYDTGPIIVQRTCPVHEDDTPDDLARRVFAQECEAYPQAIDLIAAGRVQIIHRRARISPP